MKNTATLLLAAALALGSLGGFLGSLAANWATGDELGSIRFSQDVFTKGLRVDPTDSAQTFEVDEDGNVTASGTLAVTGELTAPIVERGTLEALSTTSTAKTLTAAQVCDANVITWDAVSVSSTLTLPTATSTVADCLIADGDSVSFLFDNTSTSTATEITIVAGVGMELIGASSSASTEDKVPGESQARVRITRTSATAAIVELQKYGPAD